MNRTRIPVAAAMFLAACNPGIHAVEPFLSPRARDHQIRRVHGLAAEKSEGKHEFKRRGDLIAHPRVKGLLNNRDLVRESQNMTLSPRAAETFPRLHRPVARQQANAGGSEKSL